METSVKERLRQFIKYTGLSINKFEQACGLGKSYVGNMRVSLQPDKIQSIVRKFPELNTGWLLTGEGEMLRESSPAEQKEYPAIVKPIPYYNVDFTGNFSLVYNDNAVTPDGYIQLPGYDKADCWVNVVGKSMEPTIEHGDIIAIRRVEDWQEDILYGEVYAIVTDEYRTIKRVRRSDTQDRIRLVPDNREYDPQDVLKSKVVAVFRVLGVMRNV